MSIDAHYEFNIAVTGSPMTERFNKNEKMSAGLPSGQAPFTDPMTRSKASYAYELQQQVSIFQILSRIIGSRKIPQKKEGTRERSQGRFTDVEREI